MSQQIEMSGFARGNFFSVAAKTAFSAPSPNHLSRSVAGEISGSLLSSDRLPIGLIGCQLSPRG